MTARWLRAALALALLAPACASAQFSAGVSPPRFELRAQPGDTLREVITLFNSGDAEETYLVRTADWDLRRDGGVVIQPPELQPGSCRPWTRIERREVALAAGANKRYRFEVAVPGDAADGECRFALLVEAAPPSQSAEREPGFSLRLPISARLAVIVYVIVGDAQPELVIEGAAMRALRGREVPVVTLRNTGAAHGRTGGFATAEDAAGRRFDLIVLPAPILPGATADVILQPDPELYGQDWPEWQPPLRLRGTIETGGADRRLDLEAR